MLFLLSACEARAAAFLQPQGRGQIITASYIDLSERYFNASGQLRRISPYRQMDIVTHAEFGATDWLTLIFGTASSFAFGTAGRAPAADHYLFVQGGARAKLVAYGPSIVSVQAVFQAPQLQERTPWAWLRRESGVTDLRLMYGHAFALADFPAFVSIDGGWRHRAGAPAQAQLDVSFGLRPLPQLLLLAQSFNVISASPGGRQKRAHRLQASLVYDLFAGWSVQAGGFVTPAGRNARQERGVLGGVWYRF